MSGGLWADLMTPPRRRRWLALNLVAMALPFLVVTWPPLTDLPQHLALMRLGQEVLEGAHPELRIQLWAPYTLGYVPIVLLWPLVGPLWAGKLTFALVAVAFGASLHLLAARRRRPPEVAALASLLFFGHPLYWGFLSFVVGMPVFIVHLMVTGDDDGPHPAWAWALTLGLLWTSHALWLAAGLAVGGAQVLAALGRRRILWAQAGVLALATLGAAAWYVASWDAAMPPSVTGWQGGLLPRLNFIWFTDAVLGGLAGPAEVIVVALMLAFLGHALYEARHGRGDGIRWDLFAVGLVFVLAAFALPYKYKRTIFFGSRWCGLGMALLLIAAPVSARWARWRPRAVAAVVGMFLALTLWRWVDFDRHAMAGLTEALAPITAGDRVVGLDLPRRHPSFVHRPYMQAFAYAKALKGAEIEFSFVEFPHMPVSRRAGHTPSDHRSIHWNAKNFSAQALARFNRLLVVGSDEERAAFEASFDVVPLSEGAPWRLYGPGSDAPSP